MPVALTIATAWHGAPRGAPLWRSRRGWLVFSAAPALCALTLLVSIAFLPASVSGVRDGRLTAMLPDPGVSSPSAPEINRVAVRQVGVILNMANGALITALITDDGDAVDRARSALLAAADQADHALRSPPAVPAGGPRALPGHPDSRLRAALGYTRAAVAYARAGALADDIRRLERAQTLLRMASE